jgi:NHS family xanthosine MFS transporter
VTAAATQPLPAVAAATPRGRRLLLSLLLFAQHGVLGLWAPILGLHLQNLGFSVQQAATIFAALPVATILSPWLGGQLADRWLPAERVLLISHHRRHRRLSPP